MFFFTSFGASLHLILSLIILNWQNACEPLNHYNFEGKQQFVHLHHQVFNIDLVFGRFI